MELEATTANLDELLAKVEILRKKVVEEDARCISLEKEKENITMNALIERENLSRRMVTLQEQNKKLEDKSTSLHSNMFGDIGKMRSKVKEYEKNI